MNGDLTDLYQEVILDHSKSPRNFGAAEEATHTARGNNPLCGDRVAVYLTLEDDVISDAHFDGRGCAISVASASMMTEMVKGKTVAEAESLFEQFHALVTGEEDAKEDDGLDELASLAGVRAFPTRIKCATLAWHAMQAAIHNDNSEDVRTE